MSTRLSMAQQAHCNLSSCFNLGRMLVEFPKAHQQASPARSMPTLLITGGAGFIGGHTATMAIQRGWQVRLLDNL